MGERRITGQGGCEAMHPALNALLADYAAGTLAPMAHALVGAHLELCPSNRAFVETLECELGHCIASDEACRIARRDERLAAIFEAECGGIRPACCPDPKTLRRLIGGEIDTLTFVPAGPGRAEYRLAATPGGDSVLCRLAPGAPVPLPRGGGLEMILVLRGGFFTGKRHVTRGDILIVDGEAAPDGVAAPEDECLYLSVVEAPHAPSPRSRAVTRAGDGDHPRR